MRIQVDANILLRVRDADDPRHAVCVEALNRLQDGTNELLICAQVLIEYWAVATRLRDVNGLGLSAAEAALDFDEFCRAFVLLPEPHYGFARHTAFPTAPAAELWRSAALQALVERS